MKKILALCLCIAVFVIAALPLQGQNRARTHGDKLRRVLRAIPNQYIVVLD